MSVIMSCISFDFLTQIFTYRFCHWYVNVQNRMIITNKCLSTVIRNLSKQKATVTMYPSLLSVNLQNLQPSSCYSKTGETRVPQHRLWRTTIRELLVRVVNPNLWPMTYQPKNKKIIFLLLTPDIVCQRLESQVPPQHHSWRPIQTINYADF